MKTRCLTLADIFGTWGPSFYDRVKTAELFCERVSEALDFFGLPGSAFVEEKRVAKITYPDFYAEYTSSSRAFGEEKRYLEMLDHIMAVVRYGADYFVQKDTPNG